MSVRTPPLYTCGNITAQDFGGGGGGAGGGLGKLWFNPNLLSGGGGGSHNLPWITPSPDNGGFGSGLTELAGYSEDTFNVSPSVAMRAAPVRYFDGTLRMDTTDLSSGAFGVPWGQTRSWTNGTNYVATVVNGNGTILSQEPHLAVSDQGATLGSSPTAPTPASFTAPTSFKMKAATGATGRKTMGTIR